jgi:hypothetical protein
MSRTLGDARGLRVTIRRSRTDQEGQGAVIALLCGAVACPVAAFKAYSCVLTSAAARNAHRSQAPLVVQ